jgi:hypothetical protein
MNGVFKLANIFSIHGSNINRIKTSGTSYDSLKKVVVNSVTSFYPKNKCNYFGKPSEILV